MTVSEGINLLSEMTWLGPFHWRIHTHMDHRHLIWSSRRESDDEWGFAPTSIHFKLPKRTEKNEISHMQRSQPSASLSGVGIGTLREVSTSTLGGVRLGSRKQGLLRGSYWAPIQTIEHGHPVDTTLR